MIFEAKANDIASIEIKAFLYGKIIEDGGRNRYNQFIAICSIAITRFDCKHILLFLPPHRLIEVRLTQNS
jgi:hypothetical protein